MADPLISDSGLTQAAADPQSAAVDGQAATARPIADLIMLDRYAAARTSAGLRSRGLRFSKLLPSGPCSDRGASTLGGGFNSSGGLI